jgi:hypothetical protein
MDGVSESVPSQLALQVLNSNSGNVNIEYRLPVTESIELHLYDVLGDEVRTLATGLCSMGIPSMQLNPLQLQPELISLNFKQTLNG